eukprot:8708646-Ditylum_brightwellii.AAC.1
MAALCRFCCDWEHEDWPAVEIAGNLTICTIEDQIQYVQVDMQLHVPCKQLEHRIGICHQVIHERSALLGWTKLSHLWHNHSIGMCQQWTGCLAPHPYQGIERW